MFHYTRSIWLTTFCRFLLFLYEIRFHCQVLRQCNQTIRIIQIFFTTFSILIAVNVVSTISYAYRRLNIAQKQYTLSDTYNTYNIIFHVCIYCIKKLLLQFNYKQNIISTYSCTLQCIIPCVLSYTYVVTFSCYLISCHLNHCLQNLESNAKLLIQRQAG